MGFRFRERIRILPGLSINLGRRGASMSIGEPGADVTISGRGMRSNVGVPGSGISFSRYRPWRRRRERSRRCRFAPAIRPPPGSPAVHRGRGAAAVARSWR
ncbi:MAG: DUF4236 domain-containing protein, partial [Stellaceae bacterium]